MGSRKQSRTILVAITIVFLLLSVFVLAKKEKGVEIVMIDEIDQWVGAYLSGGQTPEEFLTPIASYIDKTYIKQGNLSFKLYNPFFIRGYLSYEKLEQENDFGNFEVEIKPEAGLKRSQLEGLWGKSRRATGSINDSGPVIVFPLLIKTDYQFFGQIYADMDGDIDDPESNVTKVLVVRNQKKYLPVK